MDMRMKLRGAGLGMVLALLLGNLEAADTKAKTADTKSTEKVVKTSVVRTLKKRGSDSAAPLLERAETGEEKTKRLNYAQAMKASRTATAKMDAAYVKAVAEREQARQEAEKAKKTRLDVPIDSKK